MPFHPHATAFSAHPYVNPFPARASAPSSTSASLNRLPAPPHHMAMRMQYHQGPAVGPRPLVFSCEPPNFGVGQGPQPWSAINLQPRLSKWILLVLFS